MENLLKLDKQICHRLYTASNSINRLYRPLLNNLGITYPQYLVFLALWENDGISMSQLTERTSLDKGFLTTIIKSIDEKQFITLESDPNDKRKKIIYLSKKGKILKDKAKLIPEKLLCQITENLSDEVNLNELKRSLDIIINSLNHKS